MTMTNNNNNTEDNRRRCVLFLPGSAENSPGGSFAEKTFVVNEYDYLVISEILMGSGIYNV